jgi:alpha-galactosidase
VPRLRRLGEDPPEEVYLSDLMPNVIDQHKGAVAFDRSFQGNPLTIGGRSFQHGISVRPPSKVEYQVDGRYIFFRATVGVDLEDVIEVSRARARGEYVQFLVHGDSKRLYSSEWLQSSSRPVEVEVDIRGVKSLQLEVDCSSARWLVGTCDWAEARVSTR